MMIKIKSVCAVMTLCLLCACAALLEKDTELRSPCVAAESTAMPYASPALGHSQHPCARRPANAPDIS